MKTLIVIIVLFPLCSPAGFGQDKIILENPSFEDPVAAGAIPSGWLDCGFEQETPPDIQPGWFKVDQTAKDGDTYLGLVVRDNETWESIGQKLPEPLKTGAWYSFSLYLCRSELYLSTSKSTGQEANYAAPVKLRIWGGIDDCEKKELLSETGAIAHTEWVEYKFEVSPEQSDCEYIILEAYYYEPVMFPYNGNVLVDHFSAIEKAPN